MSIDSERSCFAGAATGFSELTGQVRPGDWERPALGDWDVRALVGHASRALSTIESYLGRSGQDGILDGPVAYFLAALSNETDPEQRRRRDIAIAERGREAGAALGDEPATYVAALVQRVRTLVDHSADDVPVAIPSGTMSLAGYLPTRTFELAVHSLDLTRALRLDIPDALRPAIAASCELAGRLAGQLPTAPELLLLLTGRHGLPENLTVL